jgi:hypothetical protein
MMKSVSYLRCIRHNGSRNYGSIATLHVSRLVRCTLGGCDGSRRHSIAVDQRHLCHMIVPGGGISADASKWISSLVVHVKVLARLLI